MYIVRVSYRLTQFLRPIPRTQSIMIQLYNTALDSKYKFSLLKCIPQQNSARSSKACCLGPWGATSSELVLQCYLITRLASLSLYACYRSQSSGKYKFIRKVIVLSVSYVQQLHSKGFCTKRISPRAAHVILLGFASIVYPGATKIIQKQYLL